MPGQFSSLHLLLHSDCTAFSYVVNTAPYSHTGNKTLNLTRTQASAGSVRGKQVSFKTCSCSVTLCFATAKFSYSIVYWNNKSYSPVICLEESGNPFKHTYLNRTAFLLLAI